MSIDVLYDGDGRPGLVLHVDEMADPLGGIEVEHAGPRILIPAEAVCGMERRTCHPDIILDGDVMTISGRNRRVVYRITGKDPCRLMYTAEWPD